MPAYSPLITEVPYPPSPREAFARLAGRPGAVLLESANRDPRLGQWSFFACDPFLTFRSKGARVEISTGEHTEVREGDPFSVLAQFLGDIHVTRPPEAPPLICGAVGYFGYDLGRFVERVPELTVDDVPVADCHLGFYGAVLAVNHQQQRAWICTIGAPETDESAAQRLAEARTEELLAHLQAPAARHVSRSSSPTLPITSTFTRAGYLAAVQRAKDYIAAGDIYQVNLSQRLSAPLATTPFPLYQRLMRENPAPFAAYFETPEAAVVSCSPERFLQVRGREVETRPIKGTRPRGATPEEDARLAAELLASEKDRAENVMIVDLERNDLGRVCEYGSVHVPELFAVESYATVHHLVSTVRGRLRPGTTALDCLREAFPGGSITGAPKVRSMEIIEELEPTRRGVYTGAIGYLCFSGDMDVNIVIRTVIVKDGVAHFQVGGGIVADSDPAAEYQETIDKGQALARALAAEAGAEGDHMAGIAWVNGKIVDADALAIAVTDRGFMYGEGLFETMRVYGGKVFRLEQHLARLRTAAEELRLGKQAESMSLAIPEALAASGLADAILRATVTPDSVVVLVRPLALPPPERYERGCKAITVPTAIAQASLLRRIKSLNYLDKLLAQRTAELSGAHYEAILLDPDGYVIEAAMRNVFAVIGMRAVTPPARRGLLPGITRAVVMQVAARVGVGHEERDLTREELLSAKECFLTSSIAEVLPVASVDGTPFPAPGPVTAALTQAYRDLVAEELNLSG